MQVRAYKCVGRDEHMCKCTLHFRCNARCATLRLLQVQTVIEYTQHYFSAKFPSCIPWTPSLQALTDESPRPVVGAEFEPGSGAAYVVVVVRVEQEWRDADAVAEVIGAMGIHAKSLGRNRGRPSKEGASARRSMR